MSMVDKPKQRLIITTHLLHPFAGFNLQNLDSYSGFQTIQSLPEFVIDATCSSLNSSSKLHLIPTQQAILQPNLTNLKIQEIQENSRSEIHFNFSCRVN